MKATCPFLDNLSLPFVEAPEASPEEDTLAVQRYVSPSGLFHLGLAKMPPSQNSLANIVRQACRLEVLATKPGNVSPNHSFIDANVDDFLKSADAIAPVLANTAQDGLGQAILNAVSATQRSVGHNTNLGIVLLLAPLCAITDWQNAKAELHAVLSRTSIDDATKLYEAIRIASPGGLGDVAKQDVADAPTLTLLECMQLAAHRDSIANQYSTNFQFVFETGLELLQQTATWTSHQQQRLGWVAVQILAQQSDSLIARKCGDEVAFTVQNLAKKTLSVGWPFDTEADIAYNALHSFLSDGGHQRNPGTTADFIAAILFCGLRSGIISCDESETSLLFTKHES